MSKFIEFNLDLFGSDGVIPLKRGDDWSLPGHVRLRRGDQVDEVNLAAVTSASAFFPCASGGVVQCAIAIVDSDCGRINISVPKEDSINVQLSDSGMAPFAVLEDPSGLVTIAPEQPVVQVQDRSFND